MPVGRMFFRTMFVTLATNVIQLGDGGLSEHLTDNLHKL